MLLRSRLGHTPQTTGVQNMCKYIFSSIVYTSTALATIWAFITAIALTILGIGIAITVFQIAQALFTAFS